MNKKQKFQLKLLIMGIIGLGFGSLIQLGFGYPNNPEEKGFTAGSLFMLGFWGFYLLYLTRSKKDILHYKKL